MFFLRFSVSSVNLSEVGRQLVKTMYVSVHVCVLLCP